MSRSFPAFILGIAVFALDQLSKWVVLQKFEIYRSREIIPGFFSLTLVTNTGAAWGIMRNQSLWLSLLAVSALVFLLIFRRHFTYLGLVPRIALGLLLGGIAGNLTDRIVHGHVIDFLRFYYGRFEWPAFNVADMAICTGVGLYLLDSLFRKPTGPEADPAIN